MSHAEIIRLLGGHRQIAAALGGLKENSVFVWSKRGIPPVWWPEVARLAVERGFRGVTPEMLKAMRTESPKRTRKAEEHAPGASP